MNYYNRFVTASAKEFNVSDAFPQSWMVLLMGLLSSAFLQNYCQSFIHTQ